MPDVEDRGAGTELPPSPLGRPDHAARRERLRASLARRELDALWVTDLTNIRYLTGFTGSNATLLLAVDADLELDRFHTDGRYTTQAEQEVPDLPRLIGRDAQLPAALEAMRQRGLGRLGFEAEALSWRAGERLGEEADTRGLHAEPTRDLVERLRATKDEHELAALRAACAITDAALQATFERLATGMTERDVARLIERTMEDLGADAPAFETIVASGPNSARPHHRPADRTLRRGDLVKIDVGARFAGYHADTTRTVALGDPGQRLREIHDLVRVAQRAGVAAVLAGESAGDVDAACREHIAGAGHGEHFSHGTGHGVGLEIHEAPSVAPGSAATLEPGMTVTVEPGIYLAGAGGVRIEDTVAVRPEGPSDVFTRTPRELLTL